MLRIMRYPDSHKAEVRERIVRSAAAALRRAGLASVSIPALMKEAGLTHGGFYGHFQSRDALVAEAVAEAAEETAKRAFADDRSLADVLGVYLSEGHVAHPEQGCVVAALGTEGPHQPAPVREAFAGVARGLLGLVERKLHPVGRTRVPSDDALRLAATMVGAVVLARLVGDAPLAQRILAAARATHRP
jgi:TetR/AcrR family transcriptional repressor of nem operon